MLKNRHGINNAPQEIARINYDAVGRLVQKKLMPNGTYSTGGTPASIVRPPNPGANTNDVAAQFICLQPGFEITANNGNTYSAQIGTGGGGASINGLQTIDYQYHIRNYLRGVNLDGNGNPNPNTAEGDLFSYKLDYESTGYYDGNIGKQIWHNGVAQRSYQYNYDNASRLKSATYSGINGEDYSIANMNYDANGNILNLQRRGKKGGGFGDIDNLSYSYNGNRLSQITDGIGGSHDVDFVQRGGANYDFWPDGSLKSDANEQIQNINYDSYLQQPTQVQLTDGRTINYYYDGGGKLIKTVYSTGEVWEFGNGMIYKNGQPYQLSMPEGRAIYQNGNWGLEFSYTDHLGNSRVGFKANGSQLEKTSETAFDPWGVVLNGLGQQNAFQNRFEMQGKESEKTFGLNRINFGARTFNPTTGVWDRSDPLSEQMRRWSPYNYNFDNPLRFIDPDGMEPGEPWYKQVSNWVSSIFSGSDASRTTQSVAATTSYTLVKSEQVRTEYVTKVSSLDKTDSQGRTQAKMEARQQTPTVMREVAEKMRPSSGESTRVEGTASKTNAGVNSMVGTLGKVGKVAGVASIGISVYNVASAENKPQAIATEGGALLGAIAGGELGAEAGAAIGIWFGGVGAVPGAIVGGVVGSIGGGILGANAGTSTYNAVTTKKEDKK